MEYSQHILTLMAKILAAIHNFFYYWCYCLCVPWMSAPSFNRSFDHPWKRMEKWLINYGWKPNENMLISGVHMHCMRCIVIVYKHTTSIVYPPSHVCVIFLRRIWFFIITFFAEGGGVGILFSSPTHSHSMRIFPSSVLSARQKTPKFDTFFRITLKSRECLSFFFSSPH